MPKLIRHANGELLPPIPLRVYAVFGFVMALVMAEALVQRAWDWLRGERS